MEKPRPSIFLYTDGAEISDAVKAAMVDAGYLPVRVADTDCVRILAAPLSVASDELGVVTRAALETIAGSGDISQMILARFGKALAQALTARQQQR